jgi:hypothetical protein
MDPRDRRLLVWIAVSTTFLAAVALVAIAVTIVGVVLAHRGGHPGRVIEGGPNGPTTTFEIRTSP